jgi:FtsP/CotA-like multicopper oxidase with cupredoxin domain
MKHFFCSYSTTSVSSWNPGADTYNFDNPIARDTVNLGSVDGGKVSIRFKADNPGPWIFHW